MTIVFLPVVRGYIIGIVRLAYRYHGREGGRELVGIVWNPAGMNCNIAVSKLCWGLCGIIMRV